jgi:hypothetical protein
LPFSWDEGKGRVLLEVTPGQELLYGVGLAGGAGLLEVSLDRGQLGELALVRFIRVGPRVLGERRFHPRCPDRERTQVGILPSPCAGLRGRGGGGERVIVDATDFI